MKNYILSHIQAKMKIDLLNKIFNSMNNKVKYSHEIPEIYKSCKEAFGADWDKGVVITYGDTVYSKYPITEDLKIHEAVHVRQQLSFGVRDWWIEYLSDSNFRFEQEVEAYQAQMKWANENCNKQYRKRLRAHIIHCMVNLYDGMCTKKEAEELITLKL